MLEATFNALPVVDTPAAALLLAEGTDFLFSDVDTPGVNYQQNRVAGVDPGMNRIVYWRRIPMDKEGLYLLGGNYTQMAQPVSAGGPFPPLAPSGAPIPVVPCCDPPIATTLPKAATAPIPYPSASYPEGLGQGSEGYVQIFDTLT